MILGIDIGGTKTLLTLFREDGTVLQQTKFPTPHVYATFVEALKNEITHLGHNTLQFCVVAAPGRIDRENGIGIAFGNLPWESVPLRDDIASLTGCPVTLENDANVAGLSEAHELPNYRKVLYVTVSTGIGTGMIIDGRISEAFQDAEFGHMMMEHDGRLQRWEDVASGSAIVAKFGKRAADIEAASDWYVIARNIAIGLIDVIAATTPDCVVIGGGVGSHFDKFGERLIEQLKIYENNLVRVPPVVGAKRAEEAVVFGCYLLARQYGTVRR